MEKRSQAIGIIAGLALVVAVAAGDYLTGTEIAFSLFYLIPVAVVTWYAGRMPGVVTAIVCACTWYAVDVATGHTYSSAAIKFWNTGIRTSFFFIVTVLMSALKAALDREKEHGRTDHLTGLFNVRFFYYMAQRELDRARRYKHPLSVVYIDLDHFKSVNDSHGHHTGDEVLRTVARTAKSQSRATDVVARLGGDEFAMLLPETSGESAQTIIATLRRRLLAEMQKNSWPVTFSIGVLTCADIPATVDELIRAADALMYSVKRNGKDNVKASSYPILAHPAPVTA